MSLALLIVLLVVIGVYWFVTQILPERRLQALLRPGLSTGLLESLNDFRHERGLAALELDDELCTVAERKAVHQVTTGISEDGWEYPGSFADMLGRSLLMEALFAGPLETMPDRIARQRDVLDDEWISCGVGVAAGRSGQIVVALVLCRQAWEAVPETGHHRSLVERLVLGK